MQNPGHAGLSVGHSRLALDLVVPPLEVSVSLLHAPSSGPTLLIHARCSSILCIKEGRHPTLIAQQVVPEARACRNGANRRSLVHDSEVSVQGSLFANRGTLRQHWMRSDDTLVLQVGRSCQRSLDVTWSSCLSCSQRCCRCSCRPSRAIECLRVWSVYHHLRWHSLIQRTSAPFQLHHTFKLP